MGLTSGTAAQPWYAGQKNIFVSRPLAKLYFRNGFGLYILNSYKFYFFPRFYGMFRDSFWEFGFRVLGLTFEVMWNKHFKF